MAPDAVEDLAAVEVAENEIEDDEVDLVLSSLEDVDGRLAAAGADRGVVEEGEHLRERVENRVVVLDDEDDAFALHRRPERSSEDVWSPPAAIGNEKLNVVPSPTTDSTSICPPCARTIP